jgi:ABC-type transport system involved in multi-copper enzyme maturation permease subunit
MILFLIGIIITMILSPIASTAPDHDTYLEEIEEEADPSEKDDEIKATETSSIRLQFGIAIFFTALIFMVVTQTLYGGEVRKGTIRSIALYPIDMNGITIAKIISISIISGVILFVMFFIPILPFYFSNTFPNFPAIIFMTYIISVILLTFSAFASHIPTYLFKNIKFSLNRLIIIFTIFAIVFTETVLDFIGRFYVITSRMSGTEADKFLEGWSETAQGLAVLSPYHGWGRILTSMFGFNTGGFDFFLIGPLGLLIIVGGFMMGKKIYLDVFHLD